MLSARDRLKLLLLPKRLYYPHLVSVHRRSGEPELGLVGGLVGSGGTAVDVGAHRGVYSFQFSRFCDQVLAFEPNPYFAEFARRALPANVAVRQLALGAEAATGLLRIPLQDGVRRHYEASLLPRADGAATADVAVEIRTLDSFSIRDVRIVKIDAEGTELEVLTGARATLARERPVLIVELLAGFYPDPAKAVDSVAQAYGYAAKLAVGGRLIDALDYLASGGDFVSRNVVFLPLAG